MNRPVLRVLCCLDFVSQQLRCSQRAATTPTSSGVLLEFVGAVFQAVLVVFRDLDAFLNSGRMGMIVVLQLLVELVVVVRVVRGEVLVKCFTILLFGRK